MPKIPRSPGLSGPIKKRGAPKRIGYWGWSWESCLSFPSDSTRRAFRRLFESLPDDVQHSLCFAPRSLRKRLDFWLDKLSAVPDPTQRGEIETVLRKSLVREANLS